jgi:hypothetical protein
MPDFSEVFLLGGDSCGVSLVSEASNALQDWAKSLAVGQPPLCARGFSKHFSHLGSEGDGMNISIGSRVSAIRRGP